MSDAIAPPADGEVAAHLSAIAKIEQDLRTRRDAVAARLEAMGASACWYTYEVEYTIGPARITLPRDEKGVSVTFYALRVEEAEAALAGLEAAKAEPDPAEPSAGDVADALPEFLAQAGDYQRSWAQLRAQLAEALADRDRARRERDEAEQDAVAERAAREAATEELAAERAKNKVLGSDCESLMKFGRETEKELLDVGAALTILGCRPAVPPYEQLCELLAATDPVRLHTLRGVEETEAALSLTRIMARAGGPNPASEEVLEAARAHYKDTQKRRKEAEELANAAYPETEEG